MPLRSPRFTGDPVLEACFAGQHRMMVPEQGDAVGKVQQALIDLGFPILGGADGVFGDETGVAVTRFKQDHGLSPTDPVVGPKTMAALDADVLVLDGAHVPTPSPSGEDPMVFLHDAVQAQHVSVSAEHAVAEKLHGILSVLLFAETSRMDKESRG